LKRVHSKFFVALGKDNLHNFGVLSNRLSGMLSALIILRIFKNFSDLKAGILVAFSLVFTQLRYKFL